MIGLHNLAGVRASLRLAPRTAAMATRSFSAAIHSRATTPSDEEILVEEGFAAKVAILNRPKKLNAVNITMGADVVSGNRWHLVLHDRVDGPYFVIETHKIERLLELYEKWEKDKHVRMVIISGAGRGFCAGGDVATVYHLGKAGEKHKGNEFFAKEYLFNYILGTYKKIHVALLNGVVMGGGNGLSIHGNFRVATENSLFAMPETAIGLHPDVGASYFLSRLPGHLGEYLGLTGSRLDGADMLSCGLATHFVPRSWWQRLADLEERLGGLNTGEAEVVGTAIDEFCDVVYPGEKSPLHRREAIDGCFEKETMEEIMHSLENEAEKCEDDWYSNTLTSLKKASPTSLKVTLRSIREGRQQSLHQCLEREYRLSVHAVNATFSTDFYEGSRALLVDKDNTPKWHPPSLEEVTSEMVDNIFAPLEGGEKELQLPVQEREGRPQSRARL